MTHGSIDQLMHDVLDGVADTDTRARLEAELAADPALRERFETLKRMFETLERIPMHEAPADLHEGLMHRIAAATDRPRVRAWLGAFADMFRSRPVPAFAMSVVTIAALALVLWTGIQQHAPVMPDATLPVTGTMAPVAPAREALLESGDTRITVRTARDAGALTVRIEGAAPSGASLDVGAGANAVPTPVLEGRGAELATAGVEAGQTGIRLTGGVDASLIFAGWPAAAGTIEVRLTTAAGAVNRTLTTGPGRNGP